MKKIRPNRLLFWFLKDDATLDMADPSVLDMYVQQVLTRGRTEDIKALLKEIDHDEIVKSFHRVEHFLPAEVRMFWGDLLGNDR